MNFPIEALFRKSSSTKERTMNKFLVLIAILLNLQSAQAEIVETRYLDQCIAKAHAATGPVAPNEILYVFDIDNTVLALKEDFGSVQWFRWQKNLIETNNPTDRVATTLDELLKAQGLIYHLSNSYTPEADTAAKLSFIKYKLGHPVIFHTSRNTNVREATERELAKNSLSASQTEWIKDFPGEFKFYYYEETSRPVSFRKGIFMSAGQDKGVMLSSLLRELKKIPKHIVFVDDEEKNLKNVEREFSESIPTTLCRYSAMDNVVNNFNSSNKAEEVQLWREFSNLVNKL